MVGSIHSTCCGQEIFWTDYDCGETFSKILEEISQYGEAGETTDRWWDRSVKITMTEISGFKNSQFLFILQFRILERGLQISEIR